MFKPLRTACAPLLLIASLGLAQPALANDHGGGGGGADLVTLETITTNLAADNSGSSRFVQLAIVLRLDDPKGAAAINAYMPQVRNDILLLLAGHSGNELKTTKGRGDLADEIRDAVNGIVGSPAHTDKRGHRQPANGPVKSTLFTSFIIQ